MGIGALGRAYIDFALEHRALYRLMFGGELDQQAAPELAAAAERAFDLLCQAVLVAAPSAPLREATISAWALVHGIAQLIIARQLAHDLDRDRLVDIATRLFAAGLAAL